MNVKKLPYSWKLVSTSRDLTSKDVERIISTLRRKSELVGLRDYKKYFGIVAREIKEKEEWKDWSMFDLTDFNKI